MFFGFTIVLRFASLLGGVWDEHLLKINQQENTKKRRSEMNKFGKFLDSLTTNK